MQSFFNFNSLSNIFSNNILIDTSINQFLYQIFFFYILHLVLYVFYRIGQKRPKKAKKLCGERFFFNKHYIFHFENPVALHNVAVGKISIEIKKIL